MKKTKELHESNKNQTITDGFRHIVCLVLILFGEQIYILRLDLFDCSFRGLNTEKDK